MSRPTFLLTKAERKAADGTVTPEMLMLHYCRVYASRFIWEDAPEDMPEGYIEESLFSTGLCGPVEAFGENALLMGGPVKRGIYGQPVTWLPSPSPGDIIPGELLHERSQSEWPALCCRAVSAEIEELCVLLSDAYNCLRQNVLALAQPVVLQGAVGGEINIREMDDGLSKWKPRVPTLDRTGLQASVLDLGGTDHTQNLIATINALDCEILARMGIKSAGTEKASGVTAEETVSISQELRLLNAHDLRIRRRWLELPRIKELFPGLRVKPGPGLEVDDGGDPSEERVQDGGDGGDPDRQGGAADPPGEQSGEEARG